VIFDELYKKKKKKDTQNGALEKFSDMDAELFGLTLK
jgi:hypothetical protein